MNRKRIVGLFTFFACCILAVVAWSVQAQQDIRRTRSKSRDQSQVQSGLSFCVLFGAQVIGHGAHSPIIRVLFGSKSLLSVRLDPSDVVGVLHGANKHPDCAIIIHL